MVSWYLIFPLVAAVVYAIGAYFMKAAQHSGVNSAQVTFWTTAVTATAFMLVYYPWGNQPWLGPASWLHVLALGVGFYFGLAFTVIALDQGAVSLATPMLGTKVVLVAGIDAWLAGGSVTAADWAAAVLTTVGVFLLAGSSSPKRQAGRKAEGLSRRKVWIALGVSLLAAIAFAAFDVGVKQWSPVNEFGRLVPPALVVALGLCATLPMLTGERVFVWPREGTLWLAVAASLFSAQALVLIWALGTYGDPTGMNVVYGSRGVWSVILVALVGVFATSVERFESRGVFLRRLLGSLVITSGIGVLVVWD